MSIATQNDPLIKLDSIKKVFLTDEVETHALAGVHFDIGRGEYVSISGPSGCGKSTLLAILGLLDTPSDGAYRLNGREVADIGASERALIRNKEIGFVFQAFNLIGDLTVFENVELPLTYREGVSKAERRERTIAALERVGMAHRVKHFPARPSCGRLADELPLQIRLDRRTAKVRVDIGIAFFPEGLPDLFNAGVAGQLKRAFDDVLGLHGNPDVSFAS
jgi:predicted ABC-type transport system involved in lysophospholipase L1 biosynthesis ATPase subunit